jgi:hypothetical protein
MKCRDCKMGSHKERKNKEVAYRFLKELEIYLNQKIPSLRVMRREVDVIVKNAKESDKERRKGFPEGVFLNQYIAPTSPFVACRAKRRHFCFPFLKKLLLFSSPVDN